MQRIDKISNILDESPITLALSFEDVDILIENWDDMLALIEQAKEVDAANLSEALAVVGLLRVEHFAKFMDQQLRLRVVDCNSRAMQVLKTMVREVAPRVLSKNELSRFLLSFVTQPLAFIFFIQDMKFMQDMMSVVEVDFLEVILTQIFASPEFTANVLPWYVIIRQASIHLPMEYADRIFERYMQGFDAWEVVLRDRRDVGQSHIFSSKDICREEIVPMAERILPKHTRQILQRLVDYDITWRKILECRRGITFLLSKLRDKFDDIIIDKLFRHDAEEWQAYLVREKMVPGYQSEKYSSAAFQKFHAFLIELSLKQRKLIMEKLRQHHISLVSMVVTHHVLVNTALFYVELGDDPSVILPGDDQDALAYFMQSRQNRCRSDNEYEVLFKLLEHGCNPNQPVIDFEPSLSYCAAIKADYIPRFLAYGVYMEDPVKILRIMVENQTLTLDIYKAMLRYVNVNLLIHFDFPDNYAEISAFALRLMSSEVFSVTEVKSLVAPAVVKDVSVTGLSKNTFLALCFMYVVGGDQYEPVMAYTFASLPKDILMKIVALCEPAFQLQEGRDLLDACTQQKDLLRHLRTFPVAVDAMQHRDPSRKDRSVFSFFLPADKLAIAYWQLKTKLRLEEANDAEHQLTACREKSVPHVLRHVSLYQHPGRNTALMNSLAEVELLAESEDLWFELQRMS